MKLSDGEKLIAYILADLMKGLKIDSAIDPDLVQEAIAGDDLWMLRWEYSAVFHSGGPSDEVVEETAEIMSMCRVLENSIGQLPPEELTQIDERDRTVFVGFDGNHEPHFGVAKQIVSRLGRFDEWKDRYLNSHSATIDHYRRMRKVFDGIHLPAGGRLPIVDIKRVLEA